LISLNQCPPIDISIVRLELMQKSLDKLPEIDYEHLEFLDELGRGASGVVWKGFFSTEDSKIEVAIKIITNFTEENLKSLVQELFVLLAVNHPNVVKFYGVVLQSGPTLVMEYCGQLSLNHILTNNNLSFGWDRFFSICKQTVNGLMALHGHDPKILHRDLKPLNILITTDWQVKVADFGLSLTHNAQSVKLREQIGTCAYMPPELYHEKKYSPQSDIYSLGIIFWEILYRVIHQKYQRPFGEFKWEGPSVELFIVVYAATNNTRPTIPETTPPNLKKLVQLCLLPEPEDRPECEQVLEFLNAAEKAYLEDKPAFERCILPQ